MILVTPRIKAFFKLQISLEGSRHLGLLLTAGQPVYHTPIFLKSDDL